ncbi:MAG: hypothetical protein PHD95_01165 [Candidatus ainarchaeum sp.]|nr:hypothetical protein [Candidatus ainarchaeum sp.]
MNASFRESIEKELLTLQHVKQLTERDAAYINNFKDGTFGLSYLGFLLYCTGRNPRGLSILNPMGLRYFDKKNIFGISVYRREKEKDGGHLMAVAPRGIDSFRAVNAFAKTALETCPQLKGKFFYIRFLSLEQFRHFLAHGYSPVQEQPWHETAFAEDETFSYSILQLSEMFNYSDNLHRHENLYIKSKWNRSSYNRFSNFLLQHGLEWQWGEYSVSEAKQIVASHFKMLGEEHKTIGSMPEDYWNLLESDYEKKFAIVGRLCGKSRDIPTSIFVGEKISNDKLAFYCCISKRSQNLLNELGIPRKATGFGALSTFALLNVFAEAKKQLPEIETIDLGGSETPELNAFKRRLGAKNHPTYWAVKQLV